MKYWRTILCATALAAGGLAVWAADSWNSANKRTTKPSAVPVAKLSTTIAAKETPASPMDSEPMLPPPQLPANPPASPVVKLTAPALELPAATEAPATPPSAPTTPLLPLPKLSNDQAPPRLPTKFPIVSGPPVAREIELRRAVPTTIQLTQTDEPRAAAPGELPPQLPSTTPTPPMIATPEPPVLGAKPDHGPVRPLALSVHTGNGMPRLEIREGERMLLQVTCANIELHVAHNAATSVPAITASGNVNMQSAGLAGTCDRLLISVQNGAVHLMGNVSLICQHANAATQLRAEELQFQLPGADALKTPAKPH